MNTLSRASVAHILGEPETYTALRARWSALMDSDRKHDLTAAHHLLYVTLLGKDWRRGFTPPTNQRKLDNGGLVGWAFVRAVRALHDETAEEWLLRPFEGIVTPRTLRRVRAVLPLPNPYAWSPADFAGGTFPFEAYVEPAQEQADARPERAGALSRLARRLLG